MELSIIESNENLLPKGYKEWKENITHRIEQAKLKAVLSVNTEMLGLYWSIGKEILDKQKNQGWGAKVIDQLSKDLSVCFPDDRGFSVRNLKYMRSFAEAYPSYPIVQVPLAQLSNLPILQATLAELSPN